MVYSKKKNENPGFYQSMDLDKTTKFVVSSGQTQEQDCTMIFVETTSALTRHS
jgi:hypothetical protein